MTTGRVRRGFLRLPGYRALVVAVVCLTQLGTSGHAANKGRRQEPPAGYVALTSAPQQKTKLSLPFAGVWGVVQGMNGDGTHTGYAAYALDFVPAEPVPPVPFEKRRRLRQHPCFGREILAAAEGKVVWARDGAADLPPFRATKRHQAGNFVILEHTAGEFTEYRHLQQGSVRVEVGQAVRRGQPIGRCGNSGNAEVPHLHFAFLGSCDPIATRPMRLSNYEVRDARGAWAAGDGDLKAGEIVRPRDELGGH
jgi:hypothetical protein